jgi:threonine dehydrogenase-like Zn-dependent dehydrogenase
MRGIEGDVIVHEPLGIIEEAGSKVKAVKKGDRVTVPMHIWCGSCAMCVQAHSSARVTTHPGVQARFTAIPIRGDTKGRRHGVRYFFTVDPASGRRVSLMKSEH